MVPSQARPSWVFRVLQCCGTQKLYWVAYLRWSLHDVLDVRSVVESVLIQMPVERVFSRREVLPGFHEHFDPVQGLVAVG